MEPERSIGLEPGVVGPYDLFEMGLAYDEEGEQEDAIASFRECLKLNPGHADAHYRLAAIFTDRGLLEEAEREYREALGLKKDFLEAYKGLAECLFRQDREEEAKICWKRALDLEKSPSERERIAFLLSKDG